MTGQRIDFFIAGVQKAGTTALFRTLGASSSIQMSRTKEPHFFDDDSHDWSYPRYDDLHRGFDWTARDVLRGEATPIYTYWPNAVERIVDYNPRARIVVSLRHPVYRAFSHWRMSTARGAETLDFEHAVSEAGRARLKSGTDSERRVHSYVERGFYAPQVCRLLAAFPRDQILFLTSDQLWLDPSGINATLSRFLRRTVTPTEPGYQATVHSPPSTRLAPTLRAGLFELFSSDIAETARLTDLDLSQWLEASYRDAVYRW